MSSVPSPNFAFLAHHDPRLVALATQAEEQFAIDPTVTLFKLRLFAEILAKRAAAKVALLPSYQETQQNLVDRLFDKGVIGVAQRTIFHDIRRVGNTAVHDGKGDHREALHQLRMARELATWFQRSFGNNRKFDPGPFVPPKEPAKPDAALNAELEKLQKDVAARAAELDAARKAIEDAKRAADEEAKKRLSVEELAQKLRDDAKIWEDLAKDEIEAHRAAASSEAARSRALEEANRKLEAELAAQQAAAAALPQRAIAAEIATAKSASEEIVLDEAATRRIIDRQLQAAGWEADTETLTWERGAQPERGKNRAIAEWPTMVDGKEGWADYVLFAGLTVLGVVEAKRKHKDVSNVVEQAKRYSRGYRVRGDEAPPPGGPWRPNPAKGDAGLVVPFLFATNGREYLRQLETKSGIWFLDARRPQNHPKALTGWYTPEGLLAELAKTVDDAHEKLAKDPIFGVDRGYQKAAIAAVESALAADQREILVAMATGTGKTRTCIGLCYRLLNAKRFRRILFLVDRTALGQQTTDVLKDLRIEQGQTFADIFEVKEIGDLKPDASTRFHVATVQSMVRRILGDDLAPADVPAVDTYDCIVVDECHRGYLLDRELSQREFGFRDEADYISKYRRVLDYFDAVKIGLTATPALHTTEIFGPPVFSYSYRQAVIDGYLVDHEPPVRIVTKLAQDGIHYRANEEVLTIDRSTQTLKKEQLEDEVHLEVETFNRRVITEPFNRAVLGELVKHIDPEGDEKTLIFCATEAHADLVVTVLKDLLDALYAGIDDEAVLRITGSSDRYLEAIRRFRNERYPNVVVTVDLLTTGIDIPKIANLVFLRRVRSRILYEQMLGRATRLCPEIGKERFRIFDAVDLYAALQDVTDMKPVVVNPLVTFEQLAKEILSDADEDARTESLQELVAKLQRKKRFLTGDALEHFETAAGGALADVVAFLRGARASEAAAWLEKHPQVPALLDRASGGGAYKVIVSEHHDEVREVTRGYGKHQSRPPADYLESFRAFVSGNMNRVPALVVVTQRPRELTRADLKALKLILDEEGYSETQLRAAWRDTRNEDIAATIIGHIRQIALGSPLVPYGERVDHAVARIKKAHKFTAGQANWLNKIAAQLKAETVVDRAALDQGAFKDKGGFKHINAQFDGKLEVVLGELLDEVWKDAG